MQDCWDTELLDLCVFKTGVEQEVAFSQQLLLPLKQNIFFWSIFCYREQRIGGQALNLQYDSINPLSWVALFLTCTGRKRVLFSFGFFFSKFFPPLNFFFFNLAHPAAVGRSHACCTHLVHIVCTLCTLSLVAALTQLLHHCTWVVLSDLHGTCVAKIGTRCGEGLWPTPADSIHLGRHNIITMLLIHKYSSKNG